jgi:arsenical pump membrane protein
MLLWFFGKDLSADHDVAQLRMPDDAIHDRATFMRGWWVLGLLLVGFSGWSLPACASA